MVKTNGETIPNSDSQREITGKGHAGNFWGADQVHVDLGNYYTAVYLSFVYFMLYHKLKKELSELCFDRDIEQ